MREVSPTPAPGGWEGMWGLTHSLVSIFPWGAGVCLGLLPRDVWDQTAHLARPTAPLHPTCAIGGPGALLSLPGPAQAVPGAAHLRPASASR